LPDECAAYRRDGRRSPLSLVNIALKLRVEPWRSSNGAVRRLDRDQRALDWLPLDGICRPRKKSARFAQTQIARRKMPLDSYTTTTALPTKNARSIEETFWPCLGLREPGGFAKRRLRTKRGASGYSSAGGLWPEDCGRAVLRLNLLFCAGDGEVAGNRATRSSRPAPRPDHTRGRHGKNVGPIARARASARAGRRALLRRRLSRSLLARAYALSSCRPARMASEARRTARAP
jgi:hypothetical protein